jgi:hypothetical protein
MSALLDIPWNLANRVLTLLLDLQPIPTAVH